MTEQQWDEFLDKLDFVQLTDRWGLLPLHWLDGEFPESAGQKARELAEALMAIKDEDEGEERSDKVKNLCSDYRTGLSTEAISLNAKLSPPGSRVTLKYLDPQNLGEGDCLITVGSWDRVGHLLAELAHPEGEHQENVGEAPVRVEPGELNYRHLLLFPDKGTASPRAFRSLCEKTLRQARGLGAQHLAVTHLHLPQTGLADRFAAAELVSAVRQMLRESPGTTVDIMTFSHRNFEDYRHWFDSLQDLTPSSEDEQEAVPPPDDEEQEEESQDVADTLKNLAQRSTALASEATASVSRWLSSARPEESGVPAWRGFSFAQSQELQELFLGRSTEASGEPESDDPTDQYLSVLRRFVRWQGEQDAEREELDELSSVALQLAQSLGRRHPLTRYFQLLEFRISGLLDTEPKTESDSLIASATLWQDLPLQRFLEAQGQDTQSEECKKRLAPVSPAGSLTDLVD